MRETTPKESIARLLTWHLGDVKEIDDPSDYADAVRTAAVHADLGDSFGHGQALLRAGSVSTPPDGGEALLRKAQELLGPFGPNKTLARCLSVSASSRLLAGDLTQARELHEQAVQTSQRIGRGRTRLGEIDLALVLRGRFGQCPSWVILGRS